MAYTANTLISHSNAMPGFLNTIGEASLYDIDSRPKFAVGSGFKRQDGAIFRYANFVTATAQGLLVSPNQANVTNASTNAIVVAPSVTYQQPDEQPGVYPGAIGSRYVIITLASVIINQFAGGYFTVNSQTGYGYIYRIKRNTATDTPASGKILVELFDPIVVALTATSTMALIGSLYNDCVATTATTQVVPVGVTMANMTANTYGWVVSHGPACVLQESSITTGQPIIMGYTTAGSVAKMGSGTTSTGSCFPTPVVGYCLQTGGSNAAACYITAYMMIE